MNCLLWYTAVACGVLPLTMALAGKVASCFLHWNGVKEGLWRLLITLTWASGVLAATLPLDYLFYLAESSVTWQAMYVGACVVCLVIAFGLFSRGRKRKFIRQHSEDWWKMRDSFPRGPSLVSNSSSQMDYRSTEEARKLSP